MKKRCPTVGRLSDTLAVVVKKQSIGDFAAQYQNIPPGRIEVMIHAPDGGRIPAPWNFEVTDIDRHFPEIQDQLCAMIWDWAERIQIP